MAFITNLEGNFFYQTKRDVVAEWLTCTGVGDIDVPAGEPTAVYCPDPLNSGQLKLDGFTQGVAASGTYSLEKPLASTYNFLLDLNCEMVGRINWVCRGVRQDPRNYEVAVLMMASTPSRKGLPAPVAHSGDEARVMTNMDLAFSPFMVVHRLQLLRQEVTNDSHALSVFFFPQRCEDRCGPARGLCEEGVIGMVGPGAYVYDGEIKKTHDGGANWGITPFDPYTWGGDTGAILGLETVTGERIVAFRSEAVAGAPAECAYTDDYGATAWNNVVIGVLNGQYVIDAEIVGGSILCVTNFGRIFRSRDQAVTWTEMYPGTVAVQFNDICFDAAGQNGYVAANGNNLMYTTGGPGGTWYVAVGPAIGTNLLSCAVNDKGHLFVGTDDGRLFRSEDGGATWVPAGAAWIDFGGGTIDWIAFEPQANYCGFLVYNTAAGVGQVHRTEDGGASWFELPGMPANNGINDGHICDANNAFFVGDVETVSGTTFILRAQIA
jgi:photosystem II stability/assembly factor-like uncharacterized protein